MRLLVIVLLGLVASAYSGTVRAQISDDLVRIGVLNDQSGVYADLGGPGSVVAARMAVEDAGAKVLGKPVDIVAGDHQSKADVGAAIARQWFDADKVDMAIGFDNSSVALAVEQVALQKDRIAIAAAVATTAFTGKNCTPNEASWLHDSYALTNTLARSVVGRGGDTWFFLTVDYAFGYSLETDATSAVAASGGKVLGGVRHPLNNADFSSYLLQAQASGAKVVALANAGGDMINATKQASEFGLSHGGQTLVSLLAFITDIHTLGLAAAQGLRFVTGFYWDRDKDTRAWSKRFLDRHGRIPTAAQASVYSAIRHYLRAVEPRRHRCRAPGDGEDAGRSQSMTFTRGRQASRRRAGCCTICTRAGEDTGRVRPDTGTITKSSPRSRASRRFARQARTAVR